MVGEVKSLMKYFKMKQNTKKRLKENLKIGWCNTWLYKLFKIFKDTINLIKMKHS